MISNKQIILINKYIAALNKYSKQKFGGIPTCQMRNIESCGDIWTQVYYQRYHTIQFCNHPILVSAKNNSDDIVFAVPSANGNIAVPASDNDEIILEHIKLTLSIR